jgi:hypothetical protein
LRRKISTQSMEIMKVEDGVRPEFSVGTHGTFFD